MIYYDQPCRFQPEVEDRIVAAIHAMLGPDARVDAATPSPDFLRFPVPTASQRKRWRQVIAEDNPERVTEILARFRQVHSFAINGCLRVEAADAPRYTWYDFTGGQRQRPYLRQQTLGGTLHWTTAPRGDDEDQNSRGNSRRTANDKVPTYDYLVFTGGLGYLSQPQTATNSRELNTENPARLARRIVRFLATQKSPAKGSGRAHDFTCKSMLPRPQRQDFTSKSASF